MNAQPALRQDSDAGIAAFFAQHPYTRDLKADVRLALAQAAERCDYGRGELLWKPSDQPRRVFFVASGLVKIARIESSGDLTTLHLVHANEICGETSLAPGLRSGDQAQALLPTEALAVPAATLLAAARSEKTLFAGLNTLLLQRRSELLRRIRQLLSEEVGARLASLLLELAGRSGRRGTRGVLLDLGLGQDELADLVGTSRPDLAASMSRLREEGLLADVEDGLLLRDVDGLAKLAMPRGP